MAAPQIPNLLSLHGRGRGRGRGASRAAAESLQIEENSEALGAKKDLIVQQTDNDASISRVSAVEAGYLDDEFAKELAPPAPPGSSYRRFPIINRGRGFSGKIFERDLMPVRTQAPTPGPWPSTASWTNSFPRSPTWRNRSSLSELDRTPGTSGS